MTPGGADPLSVAASLFPFGFGVDTEDRLCWVGPSLQKLLPELVRGVHIHDHLTIPRPAGRRRLWELDQGRPQIVLLEHTLLDLTMRGQVAYLDDERRFFLGGPWIRTEEALGEPGGHRHGPRDAPAVGADAVPRPGRGGDHKRPERPPAASR